MPAMVPCPCRFDRPPLPVRIVNCPWKLVNPVISAEKLIWKLPATPLAVPVNVCIPWKTPLPVDRSITTRAVPSVVPAKKPVRLRVKVSWMTAIPSTRLVTELITVVENGPLPLIICVAWTVGRTSRGTRRKNTAPKFFYYPLSPPVFLSSVLLWPASSALHQPFAVPEKLGG